MNLRESLRIMTKCFRCGNTSRSCIEKDTLEETEKLLQLHSYETSDLIHQYYLERLKEQNAMSDTKHGQLTIRCGFTDDSCLEVSAIATIFECVSLIGSFFFYFMQQIEILNARQLMPNNSSGTCDPFVRIQFSPEDKFGVTTKYKTNAQNKTNCPLYDEKFVM